MSRRWIRPALGAVLGALVLAHVHWDQMSDALAAVGPWFALVACLDLAGMLCDAAAIRELAQRRTSLATAFAAQASGYVVNRLTPGSTLGEPLKIAQLAREAPREVAVSAIVLYNVATFGVGVVVIVVGAPIALLALPIPAPLATAVWVLAAVLVAVLVAVIVLVRRSRFGRLLHDPTTRRGVLLCFASRGLEQLGTLLLLHALGADALAIPVLSLGIAIGWLSNLMPFGLGVADGGHYALFAAFGAASSLGVAFAMVDRTRASILALFALVASVCHRTLTAMTTVIDERTSRAADRVH